MKEKLLQAYGLAAAQDGVLLTSQARGCGLSRSNVARVLRHEGWDQLYSGVWVEPGRPVDLRLRLLAVQLRFPHLVASHGAAARLLGIWTVGSCAVELTDPIRRHRSRTPGVRVHKAALGEQEVTVASGIRVTTVLRTVCDMLLTLPLQPAVIAADSVLARRRASRESIADALSVRCARRVDVAAARRALALTDPASGSPAESKARLEIREAGLFPESQAEVHTQNGRVRRLDFFFRAEGLGVEIEGQAWHGSRSAHQNDAIRFNELARCPGIRQMLRFTYDDVFRRPQRFIRTVQEALGRLRG
ncbi:hypothetical protein AB0A70_24150 [Streptomyces morookaense]|uniref:hypothetical protein n=1 Tax=Streptomyces morookaense TaxID=1970 RepID=UPI0033C503BE